MPVSPQMQGKVVTVARHIMEQERTFPQATGEFSNLLSEITLAAKLIHREVSKASRDAQRVWGSTEQEAMDAAVVQEAEENFQPEPEQTVAVGNND